MLIKRCKDTSPEVLASSYIHAIMIRKGRKKEENSKMINVPGRRKHSSSLQALASSYVHAIMIRKRKKRTGTAEECI